MKVELTEEEVMFIIDVMEIVYNITPRIHPKKTALIKSTRNKLTNQLVEYMGEPTLSITEIVNKINSGEIK